jgi:phosphorylcholine metabolism protein LicD
MWITLIIAFDHRESLQAWFLLPTAEDDAIEIITKRKDYHFFHKQTTKNANPLRSINLSWPFTIWGIDIVSNIYDTSQNTSSVVKATQNSKIIISEYQLDIGSKGS